MLPKISIIIQEWTYIKYVLAGRTTLRGAKEQDIGTPIQTSYTLLA